MRRSSRRKRPKLRLRPAESSAVAAPAASRTSAYSSATAAAMRAARARSGTADVGRPRHEVPSRPPPPPRRPTTRAPGGAGVGGQGHDPVGQLRGAEAPQDAPQSDAGGRRLTRQPVEEQDPIVLCDDGCNLAPRRGSLPLTSAVPDPPTDRVAVEAARPARRRRAQRSMASCRPASAVAPREVHRRMSPAAPHAERRISGVVPPTRKSLWSRGPQTPDALLSQTG
jgi:hypothetical protein